MDLRKLIVLFAVSGILLPTCVSSSPGQDEKSPVFKTTKPPRPTATLQPTDIAYQLWQVFDLTQKANAGDVLAQHELGIRYLVGKGVQADTVRGAHWIEKAAAQNLTTARFNLAILTYNGWGVPWNPFESYRHFRYTAEQGMREAQYVLGQFHTDNLVVPRDLAEARRWIEKAADAGYAPAREALAELDKRMQGSADDGNAGSNRPSQSQDTTAQSGTSATGSTFAFVFLDFNADTTEKVTDLTLLKDAVRSENPEVMNALGLAKVSGAEFDVDDVTLQAIEKAAEAGSPEALTVLGRCYEKGIGVKRDLVKAAGYYVRAIRLNSLRAPELLWNMAEHDELFSALKSRASLNDPDARYAWACITALGFDAARGYQQARLTEAQALQQLERAASAGHVQATIELGLCHLSGRWVKQDEARARQLFEKAATMGSREAGVRLAALNIRSSSASPQRQGADTLSKAAAGGSILAQVALAYCLEYGVGISQNKAEAAKLYRIGAQRGSQDAYRALRRMHDEIRPKEKMYEIVEE